MERIALAQPFQYKKEKEMDACPKEITAFERFGSYQSLTNDPNGGRHAGSSSNTYQKQHVHTQAYSTNLNAQSLRLFGLHGDVNDAHRAGANRLQNKQHTQAKQEQHK